MRKLVKRWLCGIRGHRWYICRTPAMPDGKIGIDVCTCCGKAAKVYQRPAVIPAGVYHA